MYKSCLNNDILKAQRILQMDNMALLKKDVKLVHYFRKALSKLKLNHCHICDDKWFDMDVTATRCARCWWEKNFPKNSVRIIWCIGFLKTSSIFPQSSQFGKQLISLLHFRMQLHRVRVVQYVYSPHIYSTHSNILWTFSWRYHFYQRIWYTILTKPPMWTSVD